MANSGGIITAPVSFDDVRKVLGNASNHLGTLCRATNINKWSKHKPTSYPSLFPQNGVQWKGNGYSTIWGMKVDILTAASADSGKDVYESGTFTHYNWEWDKPAGGANSPYRLADFDGYNHNVKGIYIQGNAKDTVEKVYVPNTATETETMTFVVYGSNTNGVGFSDIEETAKMYANDNLRLVLSVYKKGTDTLIDEYFNNGIKLYDSSTENNNIQYDYSLDSGNSYKAVKIIFKKADFWGAAGNNEIDLYLSLQTIRRYDNMYVASRIIALPYTNETYYKRTISFFTASRYIRAVKLHNGATSTGARNWIDISPLNPIRIYDTAGTPDLQFEVSKMPNETLTFQNGVCWLRSKYKRKDGTVITVNGTLTSRTGSNIPSSITITTGTSGVTTVYYHFGNMFQESSHTTGYYPSGNYTAEIYLVKKSGSTETETMVTSVTIFAD